MEISKFKLALHWLLFIVAFYLFWAFSYLIMFKYAASEINRLNYDKGSIWSQLTASNIFWYAIFVFGMAIIIYGIKKLMQYSPNRKIAAMIYALLIIVTVGTLVNLLLQTINIVDLLPHIVINGVFLIPIMITLSKKDGQDDVVEVEEEYTESDI